MIGAIAGDIIGSVHEHAGTKTKDFPLFDIGCRPTDDTVLTLAIADHLLDGLDLVDLLHEYTKRYPDAGYGGTFRDWARSRSRDPYGSWGNGSAMRVSPVGFAFDSEADVLAQARASAVATHDHPEGIKGAQATALAIFLARKGASKAKIKETLVERFDYDLSRHVDDIREDYEFDVSCQGSVPQSIVAFLDSDSYEDAIRNAISLGGDADTMACIAGGIAEAFYGGVPENIRQWALAQLDPPQLEVAERFVGRFGL
jgi:ADP-ribosylglycohydrolase